MFLLLPSLGAQREGCFNLHYYFPIPLQAKSSPLFSAHSKLKTVATVLHFPIFSTKNIFHLILLPDTQKRRKTWQAGFGNWHIWALEDWDLEDDSKFTMIPNQGFLSRIILLKPIFLKTGWYGLVTCRDIHWWSGEQRRRWQKLHIRMKCSWNVARAPLHTGTNPCTENLGGCAINSRTLSVLKTSGTSSDVPWPST